ncbi:tRNA epoxyqueuosine(34) reductase QueG [Halosquirtibacter xylanolyticus]|uniref:tRNA epoxyqueuosine(34) reductase QueG n=1 Tax=Halosquirtibacter xylanolyticus TaxID=3374599 RepID=UPI00374A4893|nr:tRNA epoxyqueuosine(34) reductase QueG [Prolixibacteraceae bacterium]
MEYHLTIEETTHKIRNKAIELGFLACGFSQSKHLNEHEPRLINWLKEHRHGEMSYMANNLEKRVNPSLLEDGTKTIISVLLNYYPSIDQESDNKWVISKYAYGKDYHYIMKDMLNDLLLFIQQLIPEAKGRVFVDSAPVLDRAWAVESGLGWIGKNGNVISKEHGSFFFIGEILLNHTLKYDDSQSKNYCGKCTRCIDVCPTKAIYEPQKVDARKCLSYATIEYRSAEIPESIKGKLNNRLYGCDICQDICPWNIKNATPTKIEAFKPLIGDECYTNDYWENLTNGEFKRRYKSSPIMRAGLKQIRRNINWLSDENKICD